MRRELSNNNVFVWVGLHDQVSKPFEKSKRHLTCTNLPLKMLSLSINAPKLKAMVMIVCSWWANRQIDRKHHSLWYYGYLYGQAIYHHYSSRLPLIATKVCEIFCHRRPEKLRLGPIFVLHAILDFIVDNYLPITEKLGRYLREQERRKFSLKTLTSIHCAICMN